VKTILKLLVMLAVLNAVARAGSAAWTYYQFKDAVQQSVIFGGNASVTDLHNQIMTKAEEMDVPLPPENVSVQREGTRTWADVAYRQPVEVFPRFVYPIDFRFTVDAFAASLTNEPPR
jgi:hypothetical protein